MPIRRKSAPVETPWLIVAISAPCIDSTVMAKMPSMTKPRCETDEYATSFLKSGCTSATSAPYTMPITASTSITMRTVGCMATSGKSGTANRTKPNVPILSMIAARITEPAVGASTCASGSHVWNGNIGTFTANATANAPKSQKLPTTGAERVISRIAS